MSLNSTTSQIIEQVNQELLDDDGFMTVEVMDSYKGSTVNSDPDYEKPTKITSPFSFDPTRFLSNCQTMTLPRFIEVAGELLDDAQDRAGIVDDEKVTLVEEYPAEDFSRFGDEVIAWKLTSREPAKMNTSATGRPQMGFRYYYKLRSPKYPNKWVEVQARPLDHIIEFQCWSKSARLANRRALWLENLFTSHAWAVKVQGADRFYFKKRINDWYTTTGGQGLYVRPLQFFVRLYDFRVVADPVIKHITFEIGSLPSDELTKGF
jgi:hypothetical protein